MPLLDRVITAMPYELVDRVLFGSHPAAVPLQVVVQHLIGGPRPVVFDLDGVPFHCETSEKYFFERRQYERELWPVLEQHVSEDHVVYDIGAHIGYWAVRLSGIALEVYAFEPSPTNYSRLLENVMDLPNVIPVNTALAATDGTMNFVEKGSMSGEGRGAITVPKTTVDIFASKHRPPEFLLIDVEGAAGPVLAGAANVLAGRPKILAEVHGASEEDDVRSILDTARYRIVSMSDKPRYPFRLFAL